MKQAKTTSKARRNFLWKVAAVGGATGAGTAVAGILTTSPMRRKREADPRENTPSGYRETEHIRTYYEKARF